MKRPKYTPIGDELNGAVALLQAAATLDAAVYLAVESKNVAALIDITALWIGLGERLGVEADEDEEKDSKIFGFHSNVEPISEVNETVVENA